MSIFYLLPPRPFLGDRFATFLQSLFPGLDWDSAERSNLADLLAAAAGRTDVYVVYRDDLPREEPAASALIHAFGAEPGDEVVEVRPSASGETIARRWRVEASSLTPLSSFPSGGTPLLPPLT
jgi:hypothetical protein